MEKSNIKAVRKTVKRNLVIFFLFVLCESFSTYERGGHNLLTVSMLDKSLTLFLLGGGHFWPQQPKAVWHIHSFMTGVTKIHDFVYFSMCLVPLELFLKKKLWNFKKLKKKILPFWHQRVPPLEKKSKKLKIFAFL